MNLNSGFTLDLSEDKHLNSMLLGCIHLIYLRKITRFMTVCDLGSLPVTSQHPHPTLWLGETEGTSPSVGSVCEEWSHIALKYLLMLSKVTIQCLANDKSQNVNFTVP